MPKILLVEDDEDTADMIKQTLQFDHYMVEVTGDGESAASLLRMKEYDLIILDWDLPDLSGIEVCQNYRARGGSTSVLMLTGKKQSVDKVKGLDAGADDYLTKPFNMDELMARVRALLRRTGSVQSSNDLRYKDIVLSPNNYRVVRGNKELKLVPKEFAILELFMRYPGKVFSPEAILDRVWENEGDYPTADVVRTHVMNLRKKLGSDVVENVHGVGYKISGV